MVGQNYLNATNPDGSPRVNYKQNNNTGHNYGMDHVWDMENFMKEFVEKRNGVIPPPQWENLTREAKKEVVKRRDQLNAQNFYPKKTDDKPRNNYHHGGGDYKGNIHHRGGGNYKSNDYHRGGGEHKGDNYRREGGGYKGNRKWDKPPSKHERPVYVDHDPNDPLSDDAFTGEYDNDYWYSLPQRVKYEILRQRAVKKQRAERAAAQQASSSM